MLCQTGSGLKRSKAMTIKYFACLVFGYAEGSRALPGRPFLPGRPPGPASKPLVRKGIFIAEEASRPIPNNYPVEAHIKDHQT